jgi:hypothetical protein
MRGTARSVMTAALVRLARSREYRDWRNSFKIDPWRHREANSVPKSTSCRNLGSLPVFAQEGGRRKLKKSESHRGQWSLNCCRMTLHGQVRILRQTNGEKSPIVPSDQHSGAVEHREEKDLAVYGRVFARPVARIGSFAACRTADVSDGQCKDGKELTSFG